MSVLIRYAQSGRIDIREAFCSNPVVNTLEIKICRYERKNGFISCGFMEKFSVKNWQLKPNPMFNIILFPENCQISSFDQILYFGKWKERTLSEKTSFTSSRYGREVEVESCQNIQNLERFTTNMLRYLLFNRTCPEQF